MTNIQEKFLAEFERLTKAKKLEPVINKDYANVGHIFIQRGFRTYATVRYDFQGTYCGIHISGPAVAYTRPKLEDMPPLYRFTQRNHQGAAELSFHHLGVTDGVRIRYLWEMFDRVLLRAQDLADDEEDVEGFDLCDGCGAEPGAGPTKGCNEPEGCGYWRQLSIG